jgi:hypothetical protein
MHPTKRASATRIGMRAAMMYFVLEVCFDGCGEAVDDGKGTVDDEGNPGTEEVVGGSVVESRMRQNRLWPSSWQA